MYRFTRLADTFLPSHCHHRNPQPLRLLRCCFLSWCFHLDLLRP